MKNSIFKIQVLTLAALFSLVACNDKTKGKGKSAQPLAQVNALIPGDQNITTNGIQLGLNHTDFKNNPSVTTTVRDGNGNVATVVQGPAPLGLKSLPAGSTITGTTPALPAIAPTPGLTSTPPAAPTSTVEPTVQTLNLLMVGALDMIAISSLDLVEVKVQEKSAGTVKVHITWYDVNKEGEFAAEPLEFNSFDELVTYAEENAGENFVLTNETNGRQKKFFENLSEIVLEPGKNWDRVVWVKGAYMLANDVPTLLTNLIQKVAESSNVPHFLFNGVSVPEPWMLVISASTPGFSIDYLRAPLLYTNDDGDDKDEPEDRLNPAGNVFVEPQDNFAIPRRILVDSQVEELATLISDLGTSRGL